MTPRGAASPAAARCLVQAYSSRKRKDGTPQQGGTYVCGDVQTLDEHERHLREGSYRPDACRCGGTTLHRHGERLRTLLGAMVSVLIAIAIFRCPKCGATWRVLPAFLARCLHREWDVVEHAVAPREHTEERGPELPLRTRRRWEARLLQAALVPVQVLATSGDKTLRAVAQAAGLGADRRELIAAYAAAFPSRGTFASLAELLHRLTPGIRLV